MGLFGKRIKKTLFEIAMEYKKTSPKRIADMLIGVMDKEIQVSINKGYEGAFIYPFRYDLAVTNEVLEIMKDHYSNQGFQVEYEKQTNIESNRYKSFHVRWWDEE